MPILINFGIQNRDKSRVNLVVSFHFSQSLEFFAELFNSAKLQNRYPCASATSTNNILQSSVCDPTLCVSHHMSWPLTFSIHYIHPAQPKCSIFKISTHMPHTFIHHRWHWHYINHLILCSECKMQVNVSAVVSCHVMWSPGAGPGSENKIQM